MGNILDEFVPIVHADGSILNIQVKNIDWNKIFFCNLYPIEEPSQVAYLYANDVDDAMIKFQKYLDKNHVPYTNLHVIHSRRCNVEEIKKKLEERRLKLFSWKRNATSCVREVGLVRARNKDHAKEILGKEGHTFGDRNVDTKVSLLQDDWTYCVIDEYKV